MEIIKLNFNKNDQEQTILTDQENIDKLVKWVLPIIEKNVAWGSGDVTKEEFLKNPQKFQDKIDGSVWDNVHVFVDENGPFGLLEFGKTHFSDKTKKRHALLDKLFVSKDFNEFNTLMGKELDLSLLPSIESFFNSRNIYTSVGVVLKPYLHDLHTGLSKELYQLLSDGIVVGYTSNPVIVRQRRKLFKNTLFFPSFEEFPNTMEEWAICLYIYVSRKFPGPGDSVEGLEFGALYSIYNIERGDETLEISHLMKEQGKITELDEKRIQYLISKKASAGGIISWN